MPGVCANGAGSPSTGARQRPSSARTSASSRACMSSSDSGLSSAPWRRNCGQNWRRWPTARPPSSAMRLRREAAHLGELLGGRRLGRAQHLGEEPRRAHGAARQHHGRGAAVQQPRAPPPGRPRRRRRSRGRAARRRARTSPRGRRGRGRAAPPCAGGCRRRPRRRRRAAAPRRRPSSSPSRSPARIFTVTGTPRPGAAPPRPHDRGDDAGGAVRLAPAAPRRRRS